MRPACRPVLDEAAFLVGLLHDFGYGLKKNLNLPERCCLVGRDHHLERNDPSHVLVAILRLMVKACVKPGIGAYARRGKPSPAVSGSARSCR